MRQAQAAHPPDPEGGALRISEAQRAQLALALKIKTSIYVVSRKEPMWKSMELKGLVAQMPSGNWLLTPLGWNVLRMADITCEFIPTKSRPCNSTLLSISLCGYDREPTDHVLRAPNRRCWSPRRRIWMTWCKSTKYTPIKDW